MKKWIAIILTLITLTACTAPKNQNPAETERTPETDPAPVESVAAPAETEESSGMLLHCYQGAYSLRSYFLSQPDADRLTELLQRDYPREREERKEACPDVTYGLIDTDSSYYFCFLDDGTYHVHQKEYTADGVQKYRLTVTPEEMAEMQEIAAHTLPELPWKLPVRPKEGTEVTLTNDLEQEEIPLTEEKKNAFLDLFYSHPIERTDAFPECIHTYVLRCGEDTFAFDVGPNGNHVCAHVNGQGSVYEPIEEERAALEWLLREEPVQMDYYFMGSQYGLGDYPDFSTLFESPDGLSRLKEFYGALNKIVDRVEYHTQSLDYVGDYTGDVKFSANGERNKAGADNSLHTQLNTLMIGRSEYDAFDDVIEAGRNFEPEDFTVDAVADAIPVLLGYEYMGSYDIGDELPLSLHLQPLHFTVVGFLKQNTTLHFNREILLDQHIVTPFYDIAYEPTDEGNKFYQERYYTQKCEGFVRIDASADAAQMFRDVEELAEQYDLLFAVTPVKCKVFGD